MRKDSKSKPSRAALSACRLPFLEEKLKKIPLARDQTEEVGENVFLSLHKSCNGAQLKMPDAFLPLPHVNHLSFMTYTTFEISRRDDGSLESWRSSERRLLEESKDVC